MPVDGEVADPDDFLDSTVGPLVSRTRYLKNRILGTNPTAHPVLVDLLHGVVGDFSSSISVFAPVRSNFFYLQATTTAGNSLLIEITGMLPIDGAIKLVQARVKGGSSHTALPGTMPTVVLKRCAWDADPGGADPFTTENSWTDTSATYTAYETVHTIGGACDVTFNPGTYRYFIEVTNEAGADAQDGLEIHRLHFTIGEVTA